MPKYPGVALATKPVASNASPIALQRGEYAYVFGQLATSATQLPVNDSNVTFEAAPAAAQASIACDLQSAEPGQPQPVVTVEVAMNGAPGAGETITIQEADTDADAFYKTIAIAGVINTFDSLNMARVNLAGTIGKFLRVLRAPGANAVGCTVKFTKLA